MQAMCIRFSSSVILYTPFPSPNSKTKMSQTPIPIIFLPSTKNKVIRRKPPILIWKNNTNILSMKRNYLTLFNRTHTLSFPAKSVNLCKFPV